MKKATSTTNYKSTALYKFMSIPVLLNTLKNGFLFRSLKELNDCFEISDMGEKEDSKIISFTRCNSNHLMWAHYAANYSGCVIMIDRAFYQKQGISFEIVKYENRTARKNAPLNKKLLYKGKKWSYEKEHRVILDDCKGSDLVQKGEDGAFLQLHIKKIIFGCNLQDSGELLKCLEMLDSLQDQVSNKKTTIILQQQLKPDVYDCTNVPFDLRGKIAALRKKNFSQG